MIKSKPTVTIGIPAYNEEKNIAKLIKSIFNQNMDGFILSQLIVYSDGSADKTNDIVSSFSDKRILLIASTKRKGKINGIKNIVNESRDDIIILIDADIILHDSDCLKYMIAPLIKNEKIGLVSGNRIPYKIDTFIEKSIYSSIRVYDEIGKYIRNGNNPYNCHAAMLALSKEFSSSIDFPDEIFSDDTYLYFSCISNKFKFYFAKNANYKVHLAENLSDVLSQYKRNVAIDTITKTKYKDLIEREYYVPVLIKIKSLFKAMIRSPLHAIAMFFIIRYCEKMAKRSIKLSPTWEIAITTKGESI